MWLEASNTAEVDGEEQGVLSAQQLHLHTGGAPEYNITTTIAHVIHEMSTLDMVESTFNLAIKYGAKFIIPLLRYHSCGDFKHGVALLRLVRLGCGTCGTTFMKVAVEGRAYRGVGACSVLCITGVHSGISSYFFHGRRPRMVDCGTFA